MHYLKFGFLKIPYQIETQSAKKYFRIFGLKIPFTTFTKGAHKYYKVFFMSFRLPFLDKFFISQSQSNYEMRDQLTDEQIRSISSQIFLEKVGYTPNFDDPKTMNEKIFWYKLNYHDPLVTVCCDKFAVKEYVAEKIGSVHVIPTLAHWESPDEIDLSDLPERFVLKVNWSSGYNIIVKNKALLNQADARQQLSNWMQPQKNSYYQTFNWGYKDMKPVAYAEQYVEQISGQLYDYKFFCCNGTPMFWFIATDRNNGGQLTHDFYDMHFNRFDFNYGGRAHANFPLQKPRFFKEMIAAAKKLAAPFPFVRVDFYETDQQFFVGEMTFYPGGGILPFDPVEWDYRMGQYIPIPNEQ